jgi:hypothetical protein
VLEHVLADVPRQDVGGPFAQHHVDLLRGALFISTPLRANRTSPGWRPAFSAGLPGTTFVILGPEGSFGSYSMPIQPADFSRRAIELRHSWVV